RQPLRYDANGLAYPINHQHPLLGNILRFFRSSSMLESPCVQDALRDYLP
ncbi:aminobenzoate oxygenase, partial [Pseudomonas mosselii]|nr:aminobenzoate oxygenase [Pseudomonas mosselii]